jgi:ABC-type oligopeptide transport system ATPase subunit
MIEITDLHKSYKTGNSSLHVLKGINFSVKEGEIFAFLGPNGAGKSTLIKTLTQKIESIEGEIKLENKLLSHYSKYQLSKKIAIVKRDRIQDISVSSSWIQQFRNLCSAQVYVASGDHGSSFSIDDIEEGDGELYLNAMNSKLLVERGLPASGDVRPVTLPGW